jgi:hypothetical protein
MAQVIKPLSNTISIITLNGTGNTVFNAKVVYVFNRGNQHEIINFRHANNKLIGNIPIQHGTYLVVQKDPDDKVSGNNLIATSIAWPRS